ncbi:MAG TPA: type I methionyl aminopeptidase [Desulfomonilaceae bacterium]|nr:type I methionyl aminopeptidase [Desulfomonilaceae bacterium]
MKPGTIILKTAREIAIMREANIIVAEILRAIGEIIRPGVTTGELDKLADKMIRNAGAKSAFKGYRMRNQKPYPASVCSSVNEEVVHGIPGVRVLKRGDIVGVDVGVIHKGFVGDAAKTYAVGEISPQAVKLLNVTRESLYKGIEQCVSGNRLYDISGAVQKHVESNGFAVVRDFVGHGIGRNMHEPPQIPNYKGGGWNPRLEVGMVLALEPMVNEGTWRIRLMDDEWTVVTADGRLSAHFEHSVAITDDGAMILSEI